MLTIPQTFYNHFGLVTLGGGTPGGRPTDTGLARGLNTAQYSAGGESIL